MYSRPRYGLVANILFPTRTPAAPSDSDDALKAVLQFLHERSLEKEPSPKRTDPFWFVALV